MSSPSPAPAASTPAAEPAAASPQTPSSPDTTTPPATPAKAERPAWLTNDKHWDADKNEIKGEDFAKYLSEIEGRIAADDVRKGSLPQTAEGYQIKLPADFTPPAGSKFEFDVNDPILAQARTWAHTNGLTQDQFSQALGLFAGAKIGETAQIEAARTREIEKLGPTAGPRVDAVVRWMTSMDGSADKADAKALAGMLVTAKHVEAFERLITRFSNQGGASFTQSHRDVDTGKVSDEAWNKMSYGERKAYAEKHGGKAA
ncbi:MULTISPECIES: hypothetical protein [unclassified Bradyrhizobium]|uniref:hypothetical protein n=1 Tax=unclassified Bradyrhizobium TaxID=2631580 RepID=UPI00247B1A78|nr:MULTISPECIES: hypothetical protein [unclassified Bradyrhizobium]WGR74335.1 hypothetical protein MTX24_16555 [Bradyrhizobium sp. ISRA426]WGR79170.1 hypothetical protein MTX21_01670 [Bradyrhizobium sp. ISRA430]WGR90591.1 hypothetical protein MTX25_39815 [Bradyrhizobium sp. ISRA432]